jgi:hypothetical protein
LGACAFMAAVDLILGTLTLHWHPLRTTPVVGCGTHQLLPACGLKWVYCADMLASARVSPMTSWESATWVGSNFGFQWCMQAVLRCQTSVRTMHIMQHMSHHLPAGLLLPVGPS